MTYYKLRCQTCGVDFPPLRATSKEELLYLDFDEVRETAGLMNAEALEHFHQTHQGHHLEALEDGAPE